MRIYLKSADSDSMIVIAGDTAKVGEGANDFLGLTIAQGRAHTNGNFAVLFKGLDEYLELSETYNMIAQENGKYVEFLIFETYFPPATYDSLRIVINAHFLLIGTFQIPIVTPPEIGPIATFVQPFSINENNTTELRLQLKPFESLQRRGDAYHFFRDIEVVEVRNL